jgi:beta-mannosidase
VSEQSLNGAWQLRQVGAGEWLPGIVPGGVHPDLMAAGRIRDPFVGDEELRVGWVAESDWEYRREFGVEAAVATEEHVALVFDGLDTLADIRLNGEPLGSADNMFRKWQFDVTGRLRPGANELSVVFRSAVRHAAELDSGRHLASANDQLPGAPYLRKAPCHFGWDWGPKLPNIGFWQGVRLEGWSTARLADVRVEQTVERGTGGANTRGRISARVDVERTGASGAGAGPIEAVLRVAHPDGRVEVVRAPIDPDRTTAELAVEIAAPELWWPNGLGKQPLYEIEVELAAGWQRLDARSFQVGLRALELRREPDEWGESFGFAVNGVPVFAKGGNWIPADAFPARVSDAQIDSLLGAAAAANHNMVRVWGGGYYETDAFYDACDRLGILVWQDFMFACSIYPLSDEAFVANVAAEVSEQVRRLRHRPSLALWCGNNELEQGWREWGWDVPENGDLKAAYLRFFGKTLPAWVAAEDAATPYWQSSPSSGRPLEDQAGAWSGDHHEWMVWHGLAPFAAYGRQAYRFVSEFGFESLPALATVAAFAPDPADWNLESPLLDHHQRCPSGNARILFYLAQQFRPPKDFGGLVYLSQVLQAEAMRVGVEHWRREMARCRGALYWQLNDCWPVSSWSSIDYFGRWKALHYATRRFYDPVLLSARVEGDAATLSVTNDLPEAWFGEVRWSLERLDGTVVTAGGAVVEAAGLATTSVAVLSIPSSPSDRDSIVLVSELIEAGSRRALVVTPFVPDKHLALLRRKIELAIGPEAEVEPEAAVEPERSAEPEAAARPEAAAGPEAAAEPEAAAKPASDRVLVRLRSDTLARWVEVSLDGAEALWSDNYFDVPAGREVASSFELPDGWDLDRVRRALRVRSVVDTYS